MDGWRRGSGKTRVWPTQFKQRNALKPESFILYKQIMFFLHGSVVGVVGVSGVSYQTDLLSRWEESH